MKNHVLITSLLAVAVLSACSTAPTVSTAPTQVITPPIYNAPAVFNADNLKAPPGQVLAFEMAASGVQIYDCKASKDDPRKFEWAFRAPEADLLDANGSKIGKHYAGPTWEAKDGSKVVGEVLAKNDGPDANAIPWLLLKVKSNTGNGTFSKISSIQRVATVGGKAPVKGCSDIQLGAESRVPYKATYNFYKAG